MKKAIIIGASSGIGKALAERLATDVSYSLGLTGRREQALRELHLRFPLNTIYEVIDNCQSASLEEKLDVLVQRMGGLDILVLCSGRGEVNDGLNFDIEQETISLNVTAFTQITDWAARLFISQERGHMLAITSIAGLMSNRQAPAYSASKAYQINYLKSIRKKMKYLKLDVAVTDIRPGYVDTAMAKGQTFWMSSAAEAAREIHKVISSRKRIVYLKRRWHSLAFLLRLIHP